jgi:hypothetical protein
MLRNKVMFRNEEGFSLVELAIAAAAAVTIGAIAVTVSTGTSAAISSKARAGKTTADSYNSSVVYNPDVAVATGLVNLFTNGGFEALTPNKIVYGSRTTSANGNAHTGSWSVQSSYDSTTTYYDPNDSTIILYTYYNNNHLTVGLDGYTVGQKYSISFWYKGNASNLTVFGTSVAINPPSGGWNYYKVENLTATALGDLRFGSGNSFDSPDAYWVDDVTLVAGPTAL